MKIKKTLLTLLLSVGLISTLAISASGYTRTGSCGGVGCSGQLNADGVTFRAGTYANANMDYIYVTLDGKDEWWMESDYNHDTNSAYQSCTIRSVDAWSTHHADDNNGDDFNRGIGFKNGSYYNK